MGITTAIKKSGIDPILHTAMLFLQGQNQIKEQKIDKLRLGEAFSKAVDQFKQIGDDASINDVNTALYNVLSEAGKTGHLQEIFPLAKTLQANELFEIKDREQKEGVEQFSELTKKAFGPNFNEDLSALPPELLREAYDLFKPKTQTVDDAEGSYNQVMVYDSKLGKYVVDPTQTIRTGMSREQELGLMHRNSVNLENLRHRNDMKEIETRGMYDILKSNKGGGLYGTGEMSDEDILKTAKRSEDYLKTLKDQKNRTWNNITKRREDLATKLGAFTKSGMTNSKGEIDQEKYEEEVGILRKKIKDGLIDASDEKVMALREIEAGNDEIKRLTLREQIFNPASGFYQLQEKVNSEGQRMIYNPHLKEVEYVNGSPVPNQEWESAWNEFKSVLTDTPELKDIRDALLSPDGRVMDNSVFRHNVIGYLMEQAKENPLRFVEKYKNILR